MAEAGALNQALVDGDLARAAGLVADGIPVDAPDADGVPPLIYLAALGEVPVDRLAWLQGHGAALGARVVAPGDEAFLTIGATAWHGCAVRGGIYPERALEVAGWLAAGGLDPMIVDDDGAGPIHVAVATYGWGLIEALVGLGCRINAATTAGEAPLHLLVRLAPRWVKHKRGQARVVEGITRLRALGASVTQPDPAGRSPQDLARGLRLPGAIQDALGVKRSWLARLIP
jgi:hypothetical protein